MCFDSKEFRRIKEKNLSIGFDCDLDEPHSRSFQWALKPRDPCASLPKRMVRNGAQEFISRLRRTGSQTAIEVVSTGRPGLLLVACFLERAQRRTWSVRWRG